jgi:hypothetical protein
MHTSRNCTVYTVRKSPSHKLHKWPCTPVETVQSIPCVHRLWKSDRVWTLVGVWMCLSPFASSDPFRGPWVVAPEHLYSFLFFSHFIFSFLFFSLLSYYNLHIPLIYANFLSQIYRTQIMLKVVLDKLFIYFFWKSINEETYVYKLPYL